MTKIKTKKGTSKRFILRPGGTIKRYQAFKRHILTKKNKKKKRNLRGSTLTHNSNLRSIIKMLKSNI